MKHEGIILAYAKGENIGNSRYPYPSKAQCSGGSSMAMKMSSFSWGNRANERP